jgi:SOS-response transcriptional repressor LexA
MPRAATTPPLTERQRQILNYIRSEFAATGVVPTLREVADHAGLAGPTSVLYHLEALARKGYLRRPHWHQDRGWAPTAPEGCCPCCRRPLGGPP